jgi:hypothetical protein
MDQLVRAGDVVGEALASALARASAAGEWSLSVSSRASSKFDAWPGRSPPK